MGTVPGRKDNIMSNDYIKGTKEFRDNPERVEVENRVISLEEKLKNAASGGIQSILDAMEESLKHMREISKEHELACKELKVVESKLETRLIEGRKQSLTKIDPDLEKTDEEYDAFRSDPEKITAENNLQAQVEEVQKIANRGAFSILMCMPKALKNLELALYELEVINARLENEIVGKRMEGNEKSVKREDYDKYIEKLWDEFELVLFNRDKEGTLVLAESWNGFKKGTDRNAILSWFNERHSKGVYWLRDVYEKTN
jgi:hypothetical protein